MATVIRFNDTDETITITDDKSSRRWNKNESDILTKYHRGNYPFLNKNDYRFDFEIYNVPLFRDLIKSIDAENKLPYGTQLLNRAKEGSESDGTALKQILRVPIQFLEDVKIQERNPQYSSKSITSRFEPVKLWTQAGDRTFTIDLIYIALDPTTYNEIWVEKMVALFRSLSVATYSAKKSESTFNPPPRIVVKIGNLIDGIPCILSGFSRDFAESTISDGIHDETYAGNFGNERQESSGVHLPKMQKLSLTFLTSYSIIDDEIIGTRQIIKLREGIEDNTVFRTQETEGN